MAKLITAEQAAEMIPDGAVIMFGGFMGCGNAHRTIDAIARSSKGNFTVISTDAAMPGGHLGEEHYGVAKLIHNRQVKKLVASHVGRNPEVAWQMSNGELEVVLIPQGTFAEMIRAGGAGLGGILTPTGVGTMVEDAGHVLGKMDVDGKTYLIEKPLRAQFAVISGYYIDGAGNIWYKGTTRNFNPLMATAADIVIAEAETVVENGFIEPENVVTPGIFVDYIVDGGIYG